VESKRILQPAVESLAEFGFVAAVYIFKDLKSYFGGVCTAEEKLDTRGPSAAKLRFYNAAPDDISRQLSDVAHEHLPHGAENAMGRELEAAKCMTFADTIDLWHSLSGLVCEGDSWVHGPLETRFSKNGHWFIEEQRLGIIDLSRARVEATVCPV
jgi:hypothetical protein